VGRSVGRGNWTIFEPVIVFVVYFLFFSSYT
jgi:hypothetical protein